MAKMLSWYSILLEVRQREVLRLIITNSTLDEKIREQEELIEYCEKKAYETPHDLTFSFKDFHTNEYDWRYSGERERQEGKLEAFKELRNLQ